MTTEAYQKNNFLWQIQQFQQRCGEWWEVQIRKMNLDWLKPTDSPTQPNEFFLEEFFKIILAILFILLSVLAILRLFQLISPYFKLAKKQVYRNRMKNGKKSWRAAEWFRQSQFFQQEENYYQACRCLYLAMIQLLDEKKLISDLMSRTDEEYLFLTLQLPNPNPYHKLLRIHQQLCFGTQEASLNLWQECQQAYQEIEKQI